MPSRPYVLLADDTHVNLVLLERCMKRLNLRYKAASNGVEAVEAYKRAELRFDYVFMDISMPIMDGFGATRAIRDFERSSGWPPTRIVAMTASRISMVPDEWRLTGMDLLLCKPVQLKKVQSLIEGRGD